MLLTTVWLFFILGAGPLARHQAIDQFPTEEACNRFRTNVQQMLDMGAAPGSHVTDCVSRVIVTTS
jgi:hypothetical protein